MERPDTIGRWAEALAHDYLKSRGLKPVARNYRCRRGEIDLVMSDGGTLVFIEVRMRRNPRFGTAAESIDRRKRMRIITAAQHFLQNRRVSRPCRFDVVAVEGADNIQWIPNAFEVE